MVHGIGNENVSMKTFAVLRRDHSYPGFDKTYLSAGKIVQGQYERDDLCIDVQKNMLKIHLSSVSAMVMPVVHSKM
jgi:hypothetical protein